MAITNYLKAELKEAANLYKNGLISYFERLYIESKIYTELYRLTMHVFFKNNMQRIQSLLPDYAPENIVYN